MAVTLVKADGELDFEAAHSVTQLLIKAEIAIRLLAKRRRSPIKSLRLVTFRVTEWAATLISDESLIEIGSHLCGHIV